MGGHLAIALKITNVENGHDVAKTLPLAGTWNCVPTFFTTAVCNFSAKCTRGLYQTVQEVYLSNRKKKEGTM